jgi:hypothetical protein
VGVSDKTQRGRGLGPTEWLTLALVLITGAYAWLTWRVVAESRMAREQQVRPHLKIHTSAAGAGVLFPSIISVGPGAALDVVVTLTAPYRDGRGDSRVTITRPYMAPSEMVEVFLPDPFGGRPPVTFDELSGAFGSLRLNGTMNDVLGNAHTIEDVIEDLPGYLEAWGAKDTRATPDEAKRAADALGKIAAQLRKIDSKLVRPSRAQRSSSGDT